VSRTDLKLQVTIAGPGHHQKAIGFHGGLVLDDAVGMPMLWIRNPHLCVAARPALEVLGDAATEDLSGRRPVLPIYHGSRTEVADKSPRMMNELLDMIETNARQQCVPRQCSHLAGHHATRTYYGRVSWAVSWAASIVDSANRLKHWSEWQDLNLRPPRPERGALPSARASRDRGSCSSAKRSGAASKTGGQWRHECPIVPYETAGRPGDTNESKRKGERTCANFAQSRLQVIEPTAHSVHSIIGAMANLWAWSDFTFLMFLSGQVAAFHKI
jgi:hypothetical protein